jgi:hypothetical protein
MWSGSPQRGPSVVRLRGHVDDLQGDRSTKSKLIPGQREVYGFLTTAPNAVVEPIHPKAMPVILTDRRRARFLDARAVG